MSSRFLRRERETSSAVVQDIAALGRNEGQAGIEPVPPADLWTALIRVVLLVGPRVMMGGGRETLC